MIPPQTIYLHGVLEYYRQEGFHPGDEQKWEDAHTPWPRGYSDETVPLLLNHHRVHDLIQTRFLDEVHFFGYQVVETLNEANFWPSGWFDLWDIYSEFQLRTGQNLIKDHPLSIAALRSFHGDSEVQTRRAKKAGRISADKPNAAHRQLWQSLIDPELKGSPATVARQHGRRGWDPDARVRIK